MRISATERELVAAAQQGDQGAFAGLVALHQRKAYAIARAIVYVHEDAEDAVQEAFLRAYQALGKFRPEESFGAWLSRIVANAALDITRRKKIRKADELSEYIPDRFSDPGESDELRRRLSSALEGLGDRPRAVIVLHDVEGFTHVEIARMLGIPEGTARSDLHHARRQLRKVLVDLRED
ncbi:MAG: RNA polymerase sigma factor [Gemmatimonadaceae bacterium]